MKRLIWDKLIEWRNKSNRKPLIIRGARQVGKTWLMREFGKTEYEDVIYLNCDDEPRAADLFAADYDMERILLQLQAISGIKPRPAKTLIILDELQAVPRGLSALKYFYEKIPQYHVMVAGSILGIALHEGTSFPVGKVDMMTLYPMDYREYLIAMGHEDWAEWIAERRWDVLSIIRDKLIDLLRQYYFTGGMPEVVADYIENRNLVQTRQLQGLLLDAYRNDVSKHAPVEQVPRINMVMRSIPSQLAKDNKKFIYGVLKPGARAREFELAIQWLMDCGILYKVSRVSDAAAPLSFYEDLSAFKLYFLDCGLFAALAGARSDQMLIGDNVFTGFKGAFTEQFVLQQLLSRGYNDIYYWTSGATAEVDFIVQGNQEIIPIEVKAEGNVKSKSLKILVDRHPGMKGVRFSMLDYKQQDWVTNYPLYSV